MDEIKTMRIKDSQASIFQDSNRKIKTITEKEFRDIASQLPFSIVMVEKDYLVTYLLYLIRDVKGIYFKGGTALNKILLDHKRLSEDLDFSLTKNVKSVIVDIKEKLKNTIFNKITKDKDVEGFTRLIVHYKLFHEGGTIFIDLNERAKLLQKPEKHEVKHFYKVFIPEFSVQTLSKEEIIAEKISASIARNRPRDLFDIHMIIQNNLPINKSLVKEKCKQSGVEFNIIKMFNNARKLKNRWEKDMTQLLAEEVSFLDIIKTLSKHFKLKDEKEKWKKLNKR